MQSYDKSALSQRLRNFVSGRVKAQDIGSQTTPRHRHVLAALMVLALAPGLVGCDDHSIPDQPLAVTMVTSTAEHQTVKDFIYADLGLVCHQVNEKSVDCQVATDLPSRLSALAQQGQVAFSSTANARRWDSTDPLSLISGADRAWKDWYSASHLVVNYNTGQLCHVHSWSESHMGYGYGYRPFSGSFGWGLVNQTENYSEQSCVAISALPAAGQAKLKSMESLGQPKVTAPRTAPSPQKSI